MGINYGLVGLVTLVTIVTASLLVPYFEWRARLRRRVRAAIESQEWNYITQEESCTAH